jgi:hypothetical protein
MYIQIQSSDKGFCIIVIYIASEYRVLALMYYVLCTLHGIVIYTNIGTCNINIKYYYGHCVITTTVR